MFIVKKLKYPMRFYFLFALALLSGILGYLYFTNKDDLSRIDPVYDTTLPEIKERYPLIVVGTEPEGIAAAVSAARLGVKTLLVDTHPRVGGLMTLGALNSIDINRDREHSKTVVGGIFEEFFDQVEGSSFDIVTAEKVFYRMVHNEEKLTLLTEMEQIHPIMDEKRVIGLRITKGSLTRTIYADRIIDATQDADIAYEAGATFTVGQTDFGGPESGMAVTLVFKLKNVDWDAIVRFLKDDRDPNTGADKHSAWGYGQVMKGFISDNPNIRMRGLNIGLQNDGSVLINAMHIFGVNGLDPQSKENAMRQAKAELPNIIRYLREHAIGFENTVLSGTAEELYVRETRHLIAEYQLTIDDVLENRDFLDKIVIGSYPVDVQAASIKDHGNIIGDPEHYGVPFGSLVPLRVDHLLVVGRSAGYDSLANGSARTIPVGMGEGEAAGVAAAFSMKENKDFHTIAKSLTDVQAIQATLKQQGAILDTWKEEYPLKGEWIYPSIRYLRFKGVIAGGYQNDYQLDQPITRFRFYHVLFEGARRYGIPLNLTPQEAPNDKSPITSTEVLRLLARLQISAPLPDDIGSLLTAEQVSNEAAYAFIHWVLTH